MGVGVVDRIAGEHDALGLGDRQLAVEATDELDAVRAFNLLGREVTNTGADRRLHLARACPSTAIQGCGK